MSGIIKIASDAKLRAVSNEEMLVNTFHTLREEQRQMVSKLADIELEDSELKVVISTLEKVDGNRKCYRLIGGILCEKTVKDVLPVLQSKKDELTKAHAKLKEEIVKKGVELNEFKEKHGIRLPGQEESASSAGDTETTRGSASTSAPLKKQQS